MSVDGNDDNNGPEGWAQHAEQMKQQTAPSELPDPDFWPIKEMDWEEAQQHKKNNTQFEAKYPFDKLEVGKMFEVYINLRSLQQMQSVVNYHNKKSKPKRFNCCKSKNQLGHDIIKVWREE